MEQLQKKFRKMRKAYIEMTHKVEQQKDVLKTVTTKYEQLKTSKSYPLTEKTGRQILALWRTIIGKSCQVNIFYHHSDVLYSDMIYV